MNKMHVIHMLIYFIYLKIFELVILVSGMSTVWEYTDVCSKQYRCAFSIYLITVLSYSYVIILYLAINSPVRGNNAVCGINSMCKCYLK